MDLLILPVGYTPELHATSEDVVRRHVRTWLSGSMAISRPLTTESLSRTKTRSIPKLGPCCICPRPCNPTSTKTAVLAMLVGPQRLAGTWLPRVGLQNLAR